MRSVLSMYIAFVSYCVCRTVLMYGLSRIFDQHPQWVWPFLQLTFFMTLSTCLLMMLSLGRAFLQLRRQRGIVLGSTVTCRAGRCGSCSGLVQRAARTSRRWSDHRVFVGGCPLKPPRGGVRMKVHEAIFLRAARSLGIARVIPF